MEKIVVSIPNGRYENEDAVEKVISYILRLENMTLVGGYVTILNEPEDIISQFYAIQKYYNKMTGKRIIHIVFSVNKTFFFSLEHVKQLGYMIGRHFGNERQVIFAVHDDTEHLHIHMGINTVTYTNGEHRAYFDIKEIKQYAIRCVEIK